jgi:hypothetical protein
MGAGDILGQTALWPEAINQAVLAGEDARAWTRAGGVHAEAAASRI